MKCNHKKLSDHCKYVDTGITTIDGEHLTKKLWTCTYCKKESEWENGWAYFGNLECPDCGWQRIDFVNCPDCLPPNTKFIDDKKYKTRKK